MKVLGIDFGNRNVRIGMFAISALVVLCLGLNFLKGRDVFFMGKKYYCYFADVNGLTDASPVFYNGYKIGSVRSVDIQPAAVPAERFKLTLAVEQPLDVPCGTVAQLISTDILGGKGIALQFGSSADVHSSGDVLPSEVKASLADQIEPMAAKAQQIVARLDTALAGVSSLVGGDNGRRLSNAIASLEAAVESYGGVARNLEQLTSKSGSVGRMLANADTLMRRLAHQSNNIDSTLTNMSAMSADLARANIAETVATLRAMLGSINSVIADIDSASGSLGLLINDTKLYDKLAEASANMNRLLVDVRLNPSRYINISAFDFGKNVYFAQPEVGAAMAGKVYTVKLLVAKTPVDMPLDIDGTPIVEHSEGKRYHYLYGLFESIAEAQDALQKVSAQYPSAKVAAYENGSEVSL